MKKVTANTLKKGDKFKLSDNLRRTFKVIEDKGSYITVEDGSKNREQIPYFQLQNETVYLID